MPDGVVALVEEMVEELHMEARYCTTREDALCCLAKRDALSELARRLKGRGENPMWARLRPELQAFS